MTRVEVDFSTTVRGGLIRASLRRFPDQHASPGDFVEAVDDDEGLAFTGTVEEVDDMFAYLRMNWSDTSPVVTPQQWVSTINATIAARGVAVFTRATAPASLSTGVRIRPKAKRDTVAAQ